jgi:hypothetical protein
MWILESARGIATTVFIFIVLAIITGFISANVRVFASNRGFDTYLDRLAGHPQIAAAIRATIEWYRRMVAGWQPLQRRWWLWLALGLSGGVMATLWVIPGSEIQSPALEHPVRPGPPNMPTVKTDPSDIPKKLAVIDSILVLLRGDTEGLIDKGMQLSTTWQTPLSAHDMNVWQPYRLEVGNWQSKFESFSREIEKTREDNRKYPDISALLDQTYKDAFVPKMERFVGAVWSTAENPQGLTFDFFMRPIAEDFYTQLQQFQNWRRDRISNAITLRKTLSE